MEITIKNTKLLFIYRSFIFKYITFKTNNNDLKQIVKALNIKKRKDRIVYVYDEAIKEINNYYRSDLCKFIDNKCIVQRNNNSDKNNGCCYRCHLVTNNGCPSANIACKLVYCKTALKNIKKIQIYNIKILKCLSIKQRIIIISSPLLTREEVIKNINYGIIYTMISGLFNEFKYSFYKYN